MKRYYVSVTEHLNKVVSVDAESEDESYKAKRARLKAEKQAKKAGKGVA